MSSPYLTVQKVTESPTRTIRVKWSFGLAANDKRREEVACSVGPFLTFLPCPTGTKTSAVCPRQGSFSFSLKILPTKSRQLRRRRRYL